MLDLSSSQPFMDPEFLKVHPVIDEKNWFEYFKRHDEFDQNCLNIQKNFKGTLWKEEDFINDEIRGVVYIFKRMDPKMFLIKKVDIFGEDWSVLKVYVVIEGMIFSGVNLKKLLSVKIANLGFLLGGMIESLVETQDFSDEDSSLQN